MSFANKVVLISGAGSGIGEATAVAFAKSSAKLSLFDKNTTTLANVSEVCGRYNDNKVLKSVIDVTIDEDLRKVVEDTLKEYGRIDVVINCAAEFVVGSILDKNLMGSYDRAMNVNFRSIVFLTNLLAPELIKSKGNIINITSTASKIVTPGWIPYDMSKAALSHFTKSVAFELASEGVRVNSIQPGPVKTNMGINSGVFREEDNDRIWDTFAKCTALGSYIHANEIADLILYLASDKAKSITGGDYAIDSGLLLSGQRINLDTL